MKKWGGRLESEPQDDTDIEYLDESVLASEVDWRNKGVVNPIQS